MSPYIVPLEIIWQGLHAADTAQTLYIADHPRQFYERMSVSIIGNHPSRGQVWGLMIGESVAHLAISWALRDHPVALSAWEGTSIAVGAGVVTANYQIGIRF